MSKPANVKSIDAIRRFKVEVKEFETSLRQTLELLGVELRRAVDYFETDRAVYWPAQLRRASDRLAQARIDLERCQVTTRPDEGPSCYEEKKALLKAKRRLQLSEEKVRATKKWLRIVRHESEEFQSRTAQLAYLVEHESPRAQALLENVAHKLETYAGLMLSAPSKSSESRSDLGEALDAETSDE